MALHPDVRYVEAFLWSTASNLINKRWRAQSAAAKAYEALRARGVTPVPAGPDLKADVKISYELFVRLVPMLSKEHAEILWLQVPDELTQSEMAERLGISGDAAAARLWRARAKLNKLISRLPGMNEPTSTKRGPGYT